MVGDHVEDHSALVGNRAHSFDRTSCELRDVDVSEAQVDALGLDLRDQQQVLDQRIQPLGAPANHVEVLAASLVEPFLLVLHHLEEARDRRERRAELVRHRGDERVAHPVELPVRGDLSQCPDASAETAVRAGNRCRIATEHSAGVGHLELVDRCIAGRVPELEHPGPVALRLDDRVGDREEPLGHRANMRHSELDRQSPQRLVRDEDRAVRVSEADSVQRRVDERRLERSHGALRGLACTQPPSDECRA